MPNNCYFEMQITGRKESVEEFIRMISHEDEFKGYGLGRVFSFDLIDGEFRPDPNVPEFVSIRGQGDCANSLNTSIFDTKPFNLYTETKRLGIAVEAYSSEPGCFFQEHILMCCGLPIENKTVKYEEYWVEGASEAERASHAKDLGISVEELMAGMNCNGDYTVGGFGDDFGNFEDAGLILQYTLAELQQAESRAALDAKIADANSRRSEPFVAGKEQTQTR